MLSRLTVVMCASTAVVWGKLRLLSGRPRDLDIRILRHNFGILRPNYCNGFNDWDTFSSLGKFFGDGAGFSSSFHKSRWLKS